MNLFSSTRIGLPANIKLTDIHVLYVITLQRNPKSSLVDSRNARYVHVVEREKMYNTLSAAGKSPARTRPIVNQQKEISRHQASVLSREVLVHELTSLLFRVIKKITSKLESS